MLGWKVDPKSQTQSTLIHQRKATVAHNKTFRNKREDHYVQILLCRSFDGKTFAELKKKIDMRMKNMSLKSELDGKIFHNLTLKLYQTFNRPNEARSLGFLSSNSDAESLLKSFESFTDKYQPLNVIFSLK